jgi:antitoxin (DNA-binding transcriptional repressor) of toxin-antitoxin stability system
VTEPKRVKSNEARRDWAELLQFVRTGGTVIVEHYNKPIAAIVPLDRIKETAVTDTLYALCWEDPAGDEAWVIRCRPFPDSNNEGWDRWLFHPELGEEDEEAAKAWAADEFATKGMTVDDWHRDQHGDLIPKFA